MRSRQQRSAAHSASLESVSKRESPTRLRDSAGLRGQNAVAQVAVAVTGQAVLRLSVAPNSAVPTDQVAVATGDRHPTSTVADPVISVVAVDPTSTVADPV